MVGQQKKDKSEGKASPGLQFTLFFDDTKAPKCCHMDTLRCWGKGKCGIYSGGHESSGQKRKCVVDNRPFQGSLQCMPPVWSGKPRDRSSSLSKATGDGAWLCYAGPPCKLSPGIFHSDNFESLHLNPRVD